MTTSPIGIYDSGLGGLTVWREIRRALSDESLVYLADGKNCPYGSKSREEITRFADEAVAELVARGCKMVVVACNTATAAAIDFLRKKYAPLPIVGMEPAVKPACLATRSGVVGVLATERSLDGELFRRTAARYNRDVEIITAVGRGFVELVEENKEDSPEAETAVREAIIPMLERGADQIVLGCTHYPFLLPVIRRVIAEYQTSDIRRQTSEVSLQSKIEFEEIPAFAGMTRKKSKIASINSLFVPHTSCLVPQSKIVNLKSKIDIVDAAPAVARRVVQLLARYDLRAPSGHTPDYTFLTFADEKYRQKVEEKAYRKTKLCTLHTTL